MAGDVDRILHPNVQEKIHEPITPPLNNMRIAILSDAHGNAPALECCLAFLLGQGVARVFFLGDAVGYLPEASRVAELLENAGALSLQGNHEAMLSGDLPLSDAAEEVIGLRRFSDDVPQEWLKRVRRTGPRVDLEIGGRRLVLVHGSPESPLEGRVNSPTDLRSAGDIDADAVIMGHTHRPFVHYDDAGPLLLNPGSCGLPRDQGDLPALAILDLDTMAAAVHRLRHQTVCLNHRIHPSVAACFRRSCEAPGGVIYEGL